ncbi:MAG: tetratricopeptide repeat protein [Gammaproteobacteria bacterium]|nr:tetratricopeptide repeat protein [Gammaproteobacteria bacterium]
MTACTTEPKVGTLIEPTLGDLAPISAPNGPPPLPQDTREKALDAYRDYLDRYPASPTRKEIMRRLADLLMASASDLAAVAPPAGASDATLQGYRDAIALYEKLLSEYPAPADSVSLLYQLARAYEEIGDPAKARMFLERLIEHGPNVDTTLYTDAQFRRGEQSFEEGFFSAAEHAYREVLAVGESTHVYEQALYKLGWTLLKQDRHDDALKIFFAFIDRKVPPRADFDIYLATLSRAEQEQIADVFRAVSMSFSYLSGVDTVVAYFNRHGARTYEEQVYRNLAEFYAGKELLTDAARTYLALVERDPLRPEAPRLYMDVIELYRKAGLRDSVLATERAFVRNYSLNGAFWERHSPKAFPDVRQGLESALADLASHSYGGAPERREQGKPDDAERWYRTYLATFDDTKRAARMNYELAKLLEDRGAYERAVDEYERTAYTRGDHPWAAEAGRSALLVYEQIKENHSGQAAEPWSRRATTSALRFAESFSFHPDAPLVLGQAGVDLLERGEFKEAIRASETVLRKQAAPPSVLRQTAWSILAQAFFEQGSYRAAENAYRRALELTEPGDSRQAALIQGLAASIYKHGASRLAAGNRRQAVVEFLRAANAGPDSSVRPTAQYDAATSLLVLGEWSRAASTLEQLRADHPEHRLQDAATQKLALAYQRSGRKTEAAGEYVRLGQGEADDALRREAFLEAAALYKEVGRLRDAVAALELYLTHFPGPPDNAIEIYQMLAELEQARANKTQRQHWARRIIAADRSAGQARSARTRFLAAKASLDLAEDQIAAFRRVRLVEPLKYSLDKKLQEMTSALKALEETTEYGVSSVTSAATYQIASMYDELSHALRTSQPPAGLSRGEIMQYNLLIEEQAAPLQKKAIEFYQTNTLRIPQGHYDTWTQKSLSRLAELWPIRYAREEQSEADGTVTKAVLTSSGDPDAYNTLGILHRRAGRFEQAREAYQRALTLRPDYAAAHLNLGILCEVYFQDMDCAIRQYEAHQRHSSIANPRINAWIEDLHQRNKPQQSVASGDLPRDIQ